MQRGFDVPLALLGGSMQALTLSGEFTDVQARGCMDFSAFSDIFTLARESSSRRERKVIVHGSAECLVELGLERLPES